MFGRHLRRAIVIGEYEISLCAVLRVGSIALAVFTEPLDIKRYAEHGRHVGSEVGDDEHVESPAVVVTEEGIPVKVVLYRSHGSLVLDASQEYDDCQKQEHR